MLLPSADFKYSPRNRNSVTSEAYGEVNKMEDDDKIKNEVEEKEQEIKDTLKSILKDYELF